MEKHECVICGAEFEGRGHNPEPVKPFDEGRACDICNNTRVIPARIEEIMSRK